MPAKRLYRSQTDKRIAGVCGGLAEYFDIDPSIVRIIFLALILLWGWGIILYVIFWIAVSKQRV